MTATGTGPANSAMSSAEPRSRESVDLLVRQRRDLRLKLFDAARDEGAVDETAQPRVLGRLELEDRMALERVERLKMRLRLAASRAPRSHHVQDLPAEAAVAQQRGNVGVARRSTRSRNPPRRRRAPLRGSPRRRDRDRRRNRGRAGRGERGGARRRYRIHGPGLSRADRRPQPHRVRRPTRRGPNRARNARP